MYNLSFEIITSIICYVILTISNGDNEIRTRDLLLARQALSQLSYTPIKNGVHLCSHIVTNVVFSADQVLTVVFGMGTGVTPDRINTIQWD